MRRPEIAWNFAEKYEGWTSKAGPLRAPETISLGDWSRQGLEFFSGIGHYETEIDIAALSPNERLRIDLGRVGVSAEVFVNERSAGIVCVAPWTLDITDLVQPGRNALRIAVANTLANYFAQFRELDGAALSSGGERPEKRVSGLLGPVVLRTIRTENGRDGRSGQSGQKEP